MINVDISNIWGEVSLRDLLAMEQEVSQAHMTLTEDPRLSAWVDVPACADISGIWETADKIRSDSDILIVIGLGDAWLSARAVIELLQGKNRNLGKRKGDPQIFFTGDNLSTRDFLELKRLLEGKDFSLCQIAGSGDAAEPGIAFRNFRWLLERKYGTDEAEKRTYGTVAEGSDALLPIAVAGIDIGELVKGMEDARENYDLRSFENPVWLYASVRNLLYRCGKKIELLESVEPGFQTMGHWWQQRFAASEGKGGKGIFPAVGALTGDLYSLGRLIRQGERNPFETVVRFMPPEQEVTVVEDAQNADGLNGIAGKTLAQLEKTVLEGMLEDHVDAGVPVIVIDCGELREETVGELLYFFRISCGISAGILGVNLSDRSGGENDVRNILGIVRNTEENADQNI